MIGEPRGVIRYPEMPGSVFELPWDTLATGQTIAAYVKNRAKTGEPYWVTATITPRDDGFLSVRLKPSNAYLETVKAVYPELRALGPELGGEREIDRKRAMAVSGERLLEILAGAGFPGYASFMNAALAAELASRAAQLPAARSDHHQALGNTPLVSIQAGCMSVSQFLDGLFGLGWDGHAKLTELSRELATKSGFVLEVNDSYCRIVGYEREEIVGHAPVEPGILTAIDLEDMRARVIRGVGLAEHELAITTKTGDQRTLAVTARPATIGGAEREQVKARDVSDRDVREHTLRTRAAEQKALAELGLRTLTHATPEELIDQAVRAVSSALGVEIVAVDELLADGDLIVRAAVGLGERPIGVVRGSAGKGSQAGYTLLSAEPVISADLRTERRFTPAAVLMAHGARSSASVVIGTPECPWGVLIAASTQPRSFTEDDIVFFDGIAHLLGIAWQREAAERELRRLADAAELGTDAVTSIDLQARVRHWNPGAERLYGYSADEAVGRSLYELTVFTQEPRDEIERMLAGEPAYQYETRRRRKDGTVIDVLLTVSPWTVDGRVVGVTAIAIDLTERKAAERERERLAAAAEFATDAIISTDRDGVVRHWNHGATRLYGYSPEEALGRHLRELTVSAEEVTANIKQVLDGERLQYEAKRKRKDGTIIDILTTISPWTLDGEIVGSTGVSIDLTERKKLENGLQHLADHDPLTNLYSRRRFTDELERQLRLAARTKQPPALVIFDLDHLKAINDTHGHAAGDALLKAFADVIRSRARTSDVVARLGGDEFAVILPEAGKTDAPTLAHDIRALLRASWAAPSVSVSAGIVTLTGYEEITADEMLVCGDSALYEAKEHGGDQARIYSGQADGALHWVKRIHTAITQDRLVLHNQPIIDLNTGQITHRELLIRMLDDDDELIAPGRFIPTAERFGLIGEIDRWVTNAGLRLALKGTPVAINLSGHSIGDEAIIAATHAAVAQGLAPGAVIFEITETAALRNLAAARAFAATLAHDGCAVALDDFGTGFGSFTYLKHIPARYLKIDIDFVRELTTSDTDQEVVKAIVGIARSLGKLTIAEGVENPETLTLLREYGVDYAQGFHIARPQPLDQP
ncbi:MAG: EAL domain-containing protein [Solirubrobacteraceae bacterium]